MQTANHRLDDFGESLGHTMRRVAMTLRTALGEAVAELAARNAARRVAETEDDILWDDGEPEERR